MKIITVPLRAYFASLDRSRERPCEVKRPCKHDCAPDATASTASRCESSSLCAKEFRSNVQRLFSAFHGISGGDFAVLWCWCVRTPDLNHASGPRNDGESEAVQLYDRTHEVQAETQA
jgi:hypothetical protein